MALPLGEVRKMSKSKLEKIKLYYEVHRTIKEIKMDLKKRTWKEAKTK